MADYKSFFPRRKTAAGPTVAITTPTKLTSNPEINTRLMPEKPPERASLPAESFEPSAPSAVDMDETVRRKPTTNRTMPKSANCSRGLRPLAERFVPN